MTSAEIAKRRLLMVLAVDRKKFCRPYDPQMYLFARFDCTGATLLDFPSADYAAIPKQRGPIFWRPPNF